MGVLTLAEGQIWGSSKALLERILEGVLEIATDQAQKARLEIAIRGNYAHYSLIGAVPEELAQFKIVVRRLIDESEKRQGGPTPYTEGILRLLKELSTRLSGLSGS